MPSLLIYKVVLLIVQSHQISRTTSISCNKQVKCYGVSCNNSWSTVTTVNSDLHKKCVTVTANGTKTTATLLSELWALTDYAKVKAREIALTVSKYENDLNVEDIQDIVEDKLMACNRKDVANYIRDE